MRAKSYCAAIAVATMWSAMGTAQDAKLALADSDGFQEMMLDQAPKTRGMVVGASIVGLRFDSPARRYDPREIRVALGRAPSNDLLCVKFLSRDGRYSAQGRYKLGPTTPADPVLEVKTSFEKQLGGYNTTDMAILAQTAKSCDGARNANLFAVDLGSSNSGEIVVQLNAGDGRVRAQLGQNNSAVSDAAVCAPVAGEVRAGFTQDCRLHPRTELKPGLYQLSIGETASTGEIVVKTYGLTLYRAASKS